MPHLARAHSVLATALHQLEEIQADSTGDADTLERVREQLRTVQAELDDVRARLTALEGENQVLKHTPCAINVVHESRLGAIFEHALDAILIAADDGRYLDANPAACALLGYPRDEMLRLTVIDLTPEPQRFLFPQAWKDFLDLGAMSGEYTVRHRNGTPIPVEFRAVANVLPGEHLSVLRDVSRLRQAQSELRDYQRQRRSHGVKMLYSVLDTLVAAKIALQQDSWRMLLARDALRGLSEEIDVAISNIRTAIAVIDTTDAVGI